MNADKTICEILWLDHSYDLNLRIKRMIVHPTQHHVHAHTTISIRGVFNLGLNHHDDCMRSPVYSPLTTIRIRAAILDKMVLMMFLRWYYYQYVGETGLLTLCGCCSDKRGGGWDYRLGGRIFSLVRIPDSSGDLLS